MAVVTGLDNVLRNLNLSVAQMEMRTRAGLLEAGLFVRREAQKDSPIDTSNLKASAYTILSGGKVGAGASPKFKGKDAGKRAAEHSRALGIAKSKTFRYPTVTIGFSAAYAVFVHEINKNYRVGSWKFLEKALSRTSRIKRIIQSRIKRG